MRSFFTKKCFLVGFLTLLIFFLLTEPVLCRTYASRALLVWFEQMIPTLLPFMILSGFLTESQMAGSFVHCVAGPLRKMFHKNDEFCYCIIMGFFCGFPMGAKATADQYQKGNISKAEAVSLLCFCNIIGPVYFLRYVMPLFRITHVLIYVIEMYAIPFLYGIFLIKTNNHAENPPVSISRNGVHMHFLLALDHSVTVSMTQITKIGGYMILFSLFNIFPQMLLPPAISFQNREMIAMFLEISSGLATCQALSPHLCISFVQFGGLSCLAQSLESLQIVGISPAKYLFHKCILALLTLTYFLTLSAMFPFLLR
ncbi:MAG: hypothetical protein PHP50_01420 [Lachnospiraceae bacterium]|nr:hypothetical protein [Lachnospiraceae bacterium]